jgi:hypothetical protein
MTNVRISANGQKVLSDKKLSRSVLKAIGRNNSALNSGATIKVTVNGKSVSVKNAEFAVEGSGK